jgi:hypothetical protein
MLSTPEATNDLLEALAEQLSALGVRFDLVVIGGSALLALGLGQRPTRDVDVVAFVGRNGELQRSSPLPDALISARDRVATDFGLPEDWLNAGPDSLLDFGLPEGFEARLHRRDFGDSLSVHFASRTDQIHFKLYAAVDHGGGKHEADLRALDPTPEELAEAARWAITHDPSAGFQVELSRALQGLGGEGGTLSP